MSWFDKLLKFVTFVNQTIWALIGIVIVSGVIAAVVLGPRLGPELISKVVGNAGGLNIPEGASPREVIEKLEPAQRECIKKELGQKKYDDVLAERYELSPEESRNVASKCL